MGYTISIGLQIITLVVLLGLYFWQDKKIKTLEKYVGIIDLDKVEKYVSLSNKKVEMEFEDKLISEIKKNNDEQSLKFSNEIEKRDTSLRFMQDAFLASFKALSKQLIKLNKNEREIEIEKMDNKFCKEILVDVYKDID